MEIGARGTVTVAIPGGSRAGEVIVEYAGGTQTAIAYADQPIERGAPVVVYDIRGAGRIAVERTNQGDDADAGLPSP